jgi:hypothetical protein
MYVTCGGCDAEIDVYIASDIDWAGRLIPAIEGVNPGECDCPHTQEWFRGIEKAAIEAAMERGED